MSELRHRMVQAGAIRLHCLEAGPADGPLVLLLHGFPECSLSWRRQVPALAGRGFHVVAPDLRGYGDSDRPGLVSDYRIEKLAADIDALIEALGAPRAHVAGHDWGGVVAWHFAMWYPERLDRLAILNIPHPHRMLQGLRTLRQLRKSWYVFFFQLPWLAERYLAADDLRHLRAPFRNDPARPFEPEYVEHIVEHFRQPGALTAAVNYYRAAVRSAGRRRFQRIDRPVLVVWGEKDRYLGSELAQPEPRWVTDVRVERLPLATHWVHHDEPDRVNALLIEHFGRPPI